MIKTKILKLLPYWLTVLASLVLVQAFAGVQPQGSKMQPEQALAKAAEEPQVLGASTAIRGDAVAPSLGIPQLATPDVSQIKAKSFLVFKLDSGQELLQKNPDTKLGIASLTKLMTGLVAYQAADLNKSFEVLENYKIQTSPILGLLAGDNVKALDIFNSMLVGSCNDAALALAGFTENETQKNFVLLMNAEAKTLGMDNSHFQNPLGFDSKYNYSTAEDLKLLITKTQSLSAFKLLGRKTGYEFSGSLGTLYQTEATNKLLDNHPDIEAIKTGFTNNSRGAMATKVTINGHEIVILVLDSPDREGDTLKLKGLILAGFDLKR